MQTAFSQRLWNPVFHSENTHWADSVLVNLSQIRCKDAWKTKHWGQKEISVFRMKETRKQWKAEISNTSRDLFPRGRKYFYKEKVRNDEKVFTEAEYIEINKKKEKND